MTGGRAYGMPLGEEYGVRELVGLVEPIFARERSLIRWVAIRGALASLAQLGPVFHGEIPECIGLAWEENPDGTLDLRLANKGADHTVGNLYSISGLLAAVMQRLEQYDAIQAMSLDEVNRVRLRWSDDVWS